MPLSSEGGGKEEELAPLSSSGGGGGELTKSIFYVPFLINDAIIFVRRRRTGQSTILIFLNSINRKSKGSQTSDCNTHSWPTKLTIHWPYMTCVTGMSMTRFVSMHNEYVVTHQS